MKSSCQLTLFGDFSSISENSFNRLLTAFKNEECLPGAQRVVQISFNDASEISSVGILTRPKLTFSSDHAELVFLKDKLTYRIANLTSEKEVVDSSQRGYTRLYRLWTEPSTCNELGNSSGLKFLVDCQVPAFKENLKILTQKSAGYELTGGELQGVEFTFVKTFLESFKVTRTESLIRPTGQQEERSGQAPSDLVYRLLYEYKSGRITDGAVSETQKDLQLWPAFADDAVLKINRLKKENDGDLTEDAR